MKQRSSIKAKHLKLGQALENYFSPSESLEFEFFNFFPKIPSLSGFLGLGFGFYLLEFKG